jgi:tetrahydromethanopterin:alpha-L-glutamate ligase
MTKDGPSVALFISGADWHARRLVLALRAAGAAVVRTSLTKCRFDTGHPAGIDIPASRTAFPMPFSCARSIAAASRR